MIINRTFARASHWTFTIPPIKKLVGRYISDGIGWADPYAGTNELVEYTNDINLGRPSKYHLDALDFAKILPNDLSGVLFDAPYSYRQVSEHYKAIGRKVTALDTSYNFYGRVMNEITPKIKIGGYALSFRWNSNGFGKKRGFEIVEILLVAHGLNHSDTICTVERKIK